MVCLSEYVPLRILHDSSLVVCFSNISASFGTRLLRRLRGEATTREGGRQGPGTMPTGPGPTGVRPKDTDMGRLHCEANVSVSGLYDNT